MALSLGSLGRQLAADTSKTLTALGQTPLGPHDLPSFAALADYEGEDGGDGDGDEEPPEDPSAPTDPSEPSEPEGKECDELAEGARKDWERYENLVAAQQQEERKLATLVRERDRLTETEVDDVKIDPDIMNRLRRPKHPGEAASRHILDRLLLGTYDERLERSIKAAEKRRRIQELDAEISEIEMTIEDLGRQEKEARDIAVQYEQRYAQCAGHNKK